MKTSHTPGPWSIVANFVDARLPDGSLHPDNSEVGDDSEREYHSVCKVYGPQAEANARLIAAAPDLLAALRGLIAFAVKLDKEARVSGEHDAVVRARAAIAEATEEQ